MKTFKEYLTESEKTYKFIIPLQENLKIVKIKWNLHLTNTK